MWNLVCADGEFDISLRPSGFAGGYAQLAINAHRVRVGEVEVVEADVADVIRSKESAGRPKDLRALHCYTAICPDAARGAKQNRDELSVS